VNRRGFLSLLAPAAAALMVPELLVPKRTIFLPPRRRWTVDELLQCLPISVDLVGHPARLRMMWRDGHVEYEDIAWISSRV
jgi:hypothetical protein